MTNADEADGTQGENALPPPANITLVPYDNAWPETFEAAARRLVGALGDRVLDLEHVGSTAVPGLAAKPVIDIALVVADSADEAAYARDVEQAGFEFVLREPAWHQHRLFRDRRGAGNLHVFSRGCEEVARMVLFRDWLRSDEASRRLYEGTKRTLAARAWTSVDEYAAAKSAVVQDLLARAREAKGAG